jgi:general secretion pathway protein C
VGWLANTVLFVICCFLVADTANALIEAWLSGSPTPAAAAAPNADARGSSWEQRQVILARNLFHSSELSKATPIPEEVPDELEETNLPLKLWGTIASSNPQLAWASVEETDARETLSVRVGDSIKSAEVLSIERQRIVLLEKGVRRSLTLEEDEEAVPFVGRAVAKQVKRKARSRRRAASRAPRARRSARQSMAERVKKLADDRFEVSREEVQKAMSNPAELFSQARILPKMGDNGEILGVEVSAIEPDSVFQQVGIKDGDIITQVGGTPINDVGQSGQLMSALTTGEDVTITVMGPDGTEETMTIQVPE